MLYVDNGRKVLVGTGEPGFGERVAEHRGLQRVGEVRPLIEQRARAVVVLGDGRPLAEEGMVVPGQRRGVLGHQELCPVRGFVVRRPDVKRIALERQRSLEIRELLVAEAGSLAQRSGRAHPADRGVLVGEAALEGHDDVAAVLDVVRDALEQCIVGDVERGHDEHLVRGEVLGLREDDVRADVQLVQRAMHLLDERSVAVRRARPAVRRHRTAVGHEADGVGRVAAPQDSDIVFNLQADQLRADLLEFVCGPAHLRVSTIGLEVVRQDALPVGLLVRGNGSPVPVLDHVRAIGEIGIDVFAELAVVGRKLAFGGPADRLCVGFGDEEVRVLQRAREVGLDRLKRSVVVVLGAVVDVVGRDVEEAGNRLFVDVALHHAAIVGGDKLARRGALAHQPGLPVEEVGHAHLAPARPLQFVAGALRALAGGQVFPGVQVLAPVVQEPGFAEGLRRAEFLFEVVLEADEDVAIGGVVAGGFIVELPADDGGVVFIVRDDVADEPLGVEAVSGRIGVHVLPHAVGAGHGRAAVGTESIREDLRVLMGHPHRDGIRGRAEDDLDAGLAHSVDDAIHPPIVEVAVFGLPQAPGGLAHAHDVEARGLHQGDIFVETGGLVTGHVLVVVSDAVEHSGEAEIGARAWSWILRGLLTLRRRRSDRQRSAGQRRQTLSQSWHFCPS